MDFVLVLYTFFLLFFNSIALVNLFTAPILKKRKTSIDKGPLVSIIVPMRNEEENIKNIIGDLLGQYYTNLEIIAVNDNSDDDTLELLNKYKDQITIVSLDIHDKKWIGKSWAIWNGLYAAKGDILLFVDADVRLDPHCVGVLVDEMRMEHADVLNCFPAQNTGTIGETLILPLMTWSHVGHVPIALVNRSSSPALAMANGQLIMCSRTAYQKIGGHERIKGAINEDISLIKLFKKSGFKVFVILGGELVKCRMYKGFFDAFKGFGDH